jgi:DNA-binding transcriptional MerR regulator
MKTFTLKEVSKKINATPGMLRKWEKEFAELLTIPRTKQGARIYTESEINQLAEIKHLYTQKFTSEMVRRELENKNKAEPLEIAEPPTNTIAVISDKDLTLPADESAMMKADLFFEAMDTYKQTFLDEVREEIRNVLRKEVVEEVKKEIKNGTLTTVKSLSDSIYKSTANTKADLEEISENLERVSEQTSESLQYLSNSITNVSIETSEEIYTLSKQLTDSTDELSRFVSITNNEMVNLNESIVKEREVLIQDREQYRHEIRQREADFQDMLVSFRDVAASKEKKWWKFWK